MVSLMQLLLPALLSGVFVFIASSIIHMATKWHATDFATVDNQAKVMDAVKAQGLPPGDYMFPKPKDMADMKSPEFLQMFEKGPFMMTVFPAGPMTMGKQMTTWFIYSVVVAYFAGYVGSAALAPGTTYLKVFQVVGTAAFMGFALAQWPMTIWYRRDVKVSIKNTIDGLIYGLLTAGTFGWLWPR